MKLPLISSVLLFVLVAGIEARVPRRIRTANRSLPPVLRQLEATIPTAEMPGWDHFLAFVNKYEKKYATVEEARERFAIFRQNLDDLIRTRTINHGQSRHDITQFFDFTREEFKQNFFGLHLTHPKRQGGKHDLTAEDLRNYRSIEEPEALDWRQKGYVTAVKNQGRCGSCFSFGAVGAIEGQWFKKTGKLLALSEEEALDCGWEQCGGGDPLHVYDAFAELGGIETEEAYKYVAGTDGPSNCTVDEKMFVAYVNGSRAIPIEDENLLGQVLTAEGPIEVNIDASPLFDYDSGVLNPDQAEGHHVENVNHAVLLVGYGVENGQRFWIIKNSWGPQWGEEGFFRVARGTNRMFITDSNPSLPLIL